MTESSSVNYTAKRAAVQRAAEEVTQALTTISNVFNRFQDDYLAILLENEELKNLLKKTPKNSPKKSAPSTHIDDQSPSPPAKPKQIVKKPSPAPRSPSPRLVHDNDNCALADEPETPGFVETTQFIARPRKTPLKLQRSGVQQKKNQADTPSTSRTNENCSQTPSRTQKMLSLSKTDVTIRWKGGKVDRQHRLVLQPVEQVSYSIPVEQRTQSEQKNESQEKAEGEKKSEEKNKSQKNIHDNDETMFDRAFSMEDVIELSPNGNPKRKGRFRLNRNTQPKAPKPKDDVVFSDWDFEAMNPTLTQIEADATLNGSLNASNQKNKQKREEKTENNGKTSEEDEVRGKFGKFDGKVIDAGKKLNKPGKLESKGSSDVLSKKIEEQKKTLLLELCRESESPNLDGDMDETYFPRGNTAMMMNEVGIKGDGGEKRKLSAEPGPSKVQTSNADKEIVVNVEGDWDTDVSLDKWAASPPQKKQLLDSYDIVPERKKSPSPPNRRGAVRGKKERAKLPGWSCPDCEKYYEALNLNEEELRKRMNACSRHRSKFRYRQPTPEGFWNPLISDSSEQESD